MMRQEITRTWAFAWRNVLMATQNLFTLFEMIFWPTVGVLSLGFMAQFLKLTAADTAFILIGTMALSIMHICQLDVSYAILYDIWSGSLKHQFLAPISLRHMTIGSWIVGIVRGFLVFLFLAFLTWRIFAFNPLSGGAWNVAIFLVGCFLTAFAVGILVCTLVISFGIRAEAAAWATMTLILLIAGIYYPVSQLPPPLPAIASVIPLTYFLDAFRSRFGFTPEYVAPLMRGFGLSALYIVAAHWVLQKAIHRTRRNGLMLKLSA